jgi:hypothetical protein
MHSERIGRAIYTFILPALGIVALALVVWIIVIVSEVLRRWITGG